MDSPILVPPSQSGAAWPAWCSASPGRTCASVPVIRVSRVANVNTSASAPPAAQYSSWSMARAYGSMEPEMSHNTTRRRGSRSGARLATGAPRLAQRPAQVGLPPALGLPRPARPAQRHRERQLAHEPGKHEQLGGGQLGEVGAGQPLRGAGIDLPGGQLLVAGVAVLLGLRWLLAIPDHP